jgi:hypothetical protein
MTFCPFYETCKKGEMCFRAYNDEVKEGAFNWMGENAPVCYYAEQPSCHELKGA